MAFKIPREIWIGPGESGDYNNCEVWFYGRIHDARNFHLFTLIFRQQLFVLCPYIATVSHCIRRQVLDIKLVVVFQSNVPTKHQQHWIPDSLLLSKWLSKDLKAIWRNKFCFVLCAVLCFGQNVNKHFYSKSFSKHFEMLSKSFWKRSKA